MWNQWPRFTWIMKFAWWTEQCIVCVVHHTQLMGWLTSCCLLKSIFVDSHCRIFTGQTPFRPSMSNDWRKLLGTFNCMTVHRVWIVWLYTGCELYACTQGVNCMTVHRVWIVCLYTGCELYACTQGVNCVEWHWVGLTVLSVVVNCLLF